MGWGGRASARTRVPTGHRPGSRKRLAEAQPDVVAGEQGGAEERGVRSESRDGDGWGSGE